MVKPHIVEIPRSNAAEQAGNASSLTGGGQDAALSVTFTNLSSTKWRLVYWGYNYQVGMSAPTSEPSDPLLANSGQQTFAQEQILTFISQGPLSIFCVWYDESTGYRFGIKLDASFQMFNMGYRPTWQVSRDLWYKPDSEPGWYDSDDDPAATYKWPDLPYDIVATPDSGHSSLSVSVQIQDLPKHN